MTRCRYAQSPSKWAQESARLKFPAGCLAAALYGRWRSELISAIRLDRADKFSVHIIHGYVQNFGIQPGTARSSGKRKSALGKEYNFKSHIYKTKASVLIVKLGRPYH